MILFYLGILLIIPGFLISVLFWVPQIIDRGRLKAALGSRYPLVYFIYVANGPGLLLLGILLIFFRR